MSTTGRTAAGKPVAKLDRKILLGALIAAKQTHAAPSWNLTWRLAGVKGPQAGWRMERLRARGYIEFTEQAGSLRVTPDGVQAAKTGIHPKPLSVEATDGGETRFTSGNPAHRVRVSEEGWCKMNARDRSFCSMVRAAGFTVLPAHSGKSARVRPKGSRKSCAILYFHQGHLGVVIRATGAALKVTEETFEQGVQMLKAANAAPVAAKPPKARKEAGQS